MGGTRKDPALGDKMHAPFRASFIPARFLSIQSEEDATSNGIVPPEEPVLSANEVEPSEPSQAAAEPEEQQAAEREQSRQPSVPLSSPAVTVSGEDASDTSCAVARPCHVFGSILIRVCTTGTATNVVEILCTSGAVIRVSRDGDVLVVVSFLQ